MELTISDLLLYRDIAEAEWIADLVFFLALSNAQMNPILSMLPSMPDIQQIKSHAISHMYARQIIVHIDVMILLGLCTLHIDSSERIHAG